MASEPITKWFSMQLPGLTVIALAGVLWASGATAAPDREGEKLADDPTKIITKLGLRHADEAAIFGSVAFGPVSKINLSVAESGEWRFGGSYLFSFGIVNLSAARQELNNGITQTRYSIGSFLPLSALGVETGQWQVFPAFGASYVEGAAVVDVDGLGEAMPISVTSKGGYLGVMALRPLSEAWVFKSGAAYSLGSNDFSGYSLGAGLTYSLTRRDALSVYGSWTDNSLGQREQIGVSFTHEF